MIQLPKLLPGKLEAAFPGWPFEQQGKADKCATDLSVLSGVYKYQNISHAAGGAAASPFWIFLSPSHILPEHVHSKCVPEFTL